MLIEISSPINSEFVVVDNEIANDISSENSCDWRYGEADIICMGILHKDTIKIYFRKKGEDLEEYKKQIKEELDKHKVFYAFNKNMEFGNFKGFLGKEYPVEEIKAMNGKGWNKQKFFDELINDGKINSSLIPNDPLKDNSGECISCYEKEDYESIIVHNTADLIKQAILLENKNYFLEKYKDQIDERGWIRQNKK